MVQTSICMLMYSWGFIDVTVAFVTLYRPYCPPLNPHVKLVFRECFTFLNLKAVPWPILSILMPERNSFGRTDLWITIPAAHQIVWWKRYGQIHCSIITRVWSFTWAQMVFHTLTGTFSWVLCRAFRETIPGINSNPKSFSSRTLSRMTYRLGWFKLNLTEARKHIASFIK